MEEVDIKFICFNKRCVIDREQIFTYNERRNHTGHWEDVQMFNSKEMNELIQVRGRYVRDACDWAKQHLFKAINSKMNLLHLSAQDKYWNVTNHIITSKFSSLLGQNKNLVEHFQQGLGQDNKLWLLNNIYQGNEAIIREGIYIETLLLTKEITQQLGKKWKVIAEELVCHNINILSSFLDEPKANANEKERPNVAEMIEIHQQVSNNLEKTKPIKKRGRKPRKRQVQENNDDAKDMKLELESVRLRLFEINQKIDIAKAVPCDRLVINYQIPEAKVLEMISKLRPLQIVNNAQISFSNSFLEKIPIQIKSNMVFLLEYWDFKDYYERITDYLYFYSQKKDSENYKKLHMISQNWKDLPNLKNIWIGSTQDLVQVKKASLKYDHISSLTILPCLCCKKKPIPTDGILKELDPIINLNTLVLSRININKETAKIINNFIRNNTYLTCLALNYSGTVGNDFIEVISKHKLSKLFICNQDQPEEDLDFRPIFCIQSLQYLTLQRTRLTAEALQEISNLKNLVHLDIYNSYPVHPMILENLHSSLVHLNLGYCEIEDFNVDSLRKFKALKNLNLNGSFFNCQRIFEELIKQPITSVTKLSLFNYHDEPLRLRRCHDKFSMNKQIFAMIAKAFPNLVYLAIGYDCMLKEVDLDQFKKLKTFLANQKCGNIIISEDDSIDCILIKEKILK